MQNHVQNTTSVQYTTDSKAKYHLISYEVRKTLIEMVEENGFSIYKSANILNLNHSTAKAIMRKYRKQGHVFIRKHQKQIAQKLDQQQNLPATKPKTRQNKAKKCKKNHSNGPKEIIDQENQFPQIFPNTYNNFWYFPYLWNNTNYYHL